MSQRYIYRQELSVIFCIVDTQIDRVIATCADEEKTKLITQCLNIADQEDRRKQREKGSQYESQN